MEGTCLVMHHYVLMQRTRCASSRVSFLIIFEYVFRYRIKRCCLFEGDQVSPLVSHELGRQKFLDPSGFEILRHHTTSWADAQSLSTRRWHHRSYTISFDKPQWSSITVGSSGSRQLLLKDLGRFGLHVTVHRWRFPSKLSINLMFNVWMSRIACFLKVVISNMWWPFACWCMSCWHDTATLHVPDNILDSKLELPPGTEQVHSLTYLRDIGLKYFDLAVLVTDGRWSQGDIQLMNAIRAAEIPFLIARTKAGFEGDVCNAKLLIDLVSFRLPGHHLIVINNLQ